jgi:hypothetical protein
MDGNPAQLITSITIREYTHADWISVWAIFQEVVAARDTYVYDLQWTSDEARNIWVEVPPGHTVVACDGSRYSGPGSHVATASFMVAPDASGRGDLRSCLNQFAGDLELIHSQDRMWQCTVGLSRLPLWRKV